MLISLTMGKPALCCREQDQGGEGAEKVRADGPFIFSCSLATHRLSTDTLGGHMEKPGRTRTHLISCNHPRKRIELLAECWESSSGRHTEQHFPFGNVSFILM